MPSFLPPFLCLILVCLITPLTADELSAYEALKGYDFPAGLLPQGVTGYELDQATGKFSAYLSSSSCSFSIAGYQLRYKNTINGFISKGKLTDLKGVSVKILFLWISIVEVINRDDDLEFSVGIASADFPIDNFDESPKCGCGFDCVNGFDKGIGYKGVRRKGFNPFVSSF